MDFSKFISTKHFFSALFFVGALSSGGASADMQFHWRLDGLSTGSTSSGPGTGSTGGDSDSGSGSGSVSDGGAESGGESGSGTTYEAPDYFVLKTVQNTSGYYGYDYGSVAGIAFLGSDGVTEVARSVPQEGDDEWDSSMIFDQNGDFRVGLEPGIPEGGYSPVYMVSTDYTSGKYSGQTVWQHEYYGRNATLPFRVPAGMNLSEVGSVKVLSSQGLPVDYLILNAVYPDGSLDEVGKGEYLGSPVDLATEPSFSVSFTR